MNLIQYPSPNFSLRPAGVVPGGIELHGTAGGGFEPTLRWLANQVPAPDSLATGFIVVNGKKFYDSKASAHYLIGRDGKVAQMVDEAHAAWHGGGRTTVPALNGKTNLNAWTLGIEICNWLGLYKHTDGKFYTCYDGWTYPYQGPAPVSCPKPYIAVTKTPEAFRHKLGFPVFPTGIIEWWEPYTMEAIAALIEVVKGMQDRYGITKEWIKGHEECDPWRKIDPGAAFPWTQFMAAIR
jgi:N-acetyl-anhydromuramyl-L-alanine amidase AmpD